MQSFLELARARYSCRSFDSKPVESEKITKILQAGQVAPTCVNRQPWHAWVIQGAKALSRAYEATRYNFDAPLIIAVGVKPGSGWTRHCDEHDFVDVDGAIVTTHMMLEAQDLGLYSTWVGYFDPKVLADSFEEMKDYRMLAMLEIGYPSPQGVPSARHEERKSLGELVSIIK